MPHVVGVDVGGASTAAALCRLGEPSRGAELVPLDERAGAVASVVQIAADGTFFVGESGAVDPRLAARHFLRRIGDEVPFHLGDEVCSAEELTSLMILWVVGQAATRTGETARHVVVTHPLGWGPHRKNLLLRSLREAGVGNATLLAEPLAVAENHAARERVPVGALLGVHSLGAHAFGAAVVRRTPAHTFELVTGTEGAGQLAGADFDDALVAHVLGRQAGAVDPDDPQDRADMARLRHACAAAKIALSTAAEVTIPAPAGQVRITRSEFEELIRPAVEMSVAALLRVAGRTPLDAVVLAGGSARVPLVADLVEAALDCRVLVEAAPETSAVKGAALAARLLLEGPAPEAEPVETSVLARSDDASLRFPVGELRVREDELTAPPPRPPVDITPLDLPERRSVRRAVRAFGGARRGAGTSEEDGR
ncbi:Hsp70 family protein [Umezawaea beigongshangensis]|uniref:Hsp70 family protein n=1 Tax=Umezawaea beigongshangensis TaxID=2780383 RepID=UPI0018F1CFF0|nr:Hsp70 family protein [Umezawaea beigongshangensis]